MFLYTALEIKLTLLPRTGDMSKISFEPVASLIQCDLDLGAWPWPCSLKAIWGWVGLQVFSKGNAHLEHRVF